MAATAQSQAIQNANMIMGLSAQLLSLYGQITVLNNAWQDDGSLTVLQNMGTTALNVDGTAGSADATPNSAHPLDLSKYPTLSRAVSVTALANALTQLNDIVSYINGGALTATPGVRSVLNQVTGG